MKLHACDSYIEAIRHDAHDGLDCGDLLGISTNSDTPDSVANFQALDAKSRLDDSASEVDAGHRVLALLGEVDVAGVNRGAGQLDPVAMTAQRSQPSEPTTRR